MSGGRDPLVVGMVVGDVLDPFTRSVGLRVIYNNREINNACELRPPHIVNPPRVEIIGGDDFCTFYTLFHTSAPISQLKPPPPPTPRPAVDATADTVIPSRPAADPASLRHRHYLSLAKSVRVLAEIDEPVGCILKRTEATNSLHHEYSSLAYTVEMWYGVLGADDGHLQDPPNDGLVLLLMP
nr:protein HEADING DATE 3A-like [Ipomoea batatas]